MIAKPKQLRSRHLAPMFVLVSATAVFADITGDFSLSGDQTFTAPEGTVFEFNKKGNTVDLQSFTATFTGAGTFEINSSLIGSGGVYVDMTGPAGAVNYQSVAGNAYTGLTTVRSGTLLLDTSQEANNAILGDLYIGGGASPAIVTRTDKHNRELIADTSTITIASNGTLEFGRMNTGNSHNHDSLEAFSKLILDGGTLLNSSENPRLTTINILDSVQLLSSSVIDLGLAMTMNIGDVNTTLWTSDAILTIKNWSPVEPVYVGLITPDQLGQIRFELPTGIFGAIQLGDGQIVPGTLVPEASTFLFVPLLAAAAFWPEIKRRVKKGLQEKS